jgi:hypothetical protein
MGNSYPDRTNASGVWKINEISKNLVTNGTWPDMSKSRCIWAGGSTPTKLNTMDYIDIVSTGNASDFGDLTVVRTEGQGNSSFTRAVFPGGDESNVIDYVEFATTGNASDFGDRTVALVGVAGHSNVTRGLSAGGYTSPGDSDVIDFITIASTGNSIDFGNLTSGRYTLSGCGSSTRACFGGGVDIDDSDASQNIIDFVQISTLGNAIDFGNLSFAKDRAGASSTATRGFYGGGRTTNPAVAAIASIDAISINSLGNGVDFGDLSVARSGLSFGAIPTRIISGGGTEPGLSNIIDFFSPISMGTATDFGNLTVARGSLSASSQGHGGLDVFDPTTRT